MHRNKANELQEREVLYQDRDGVIVYADGFVHSKDKPLRNIIYELALKLKNSTDIARQVHKSEDTPDHLKELAKLVVNISTDQPIIIDEVDVSGCVYYENTAVGGCHNVNCSCWCKKNKNCPYKLAKRKEVSSD